MKTNRRNSFGRYLSLCIFLLTTFSQLAAHTFAEDFRQSPSHIFADQNPPKNYRHAVIDIGPSTKSAQKKSNIDLAETEIEEQEFSSRKNTEARFPIEVILEQLIPLSIHSTPLAFWCSNNIADIGNVRYIVFRALRI